MVRGAGKGGAAHRQTVDSNADADAKNLPLAMVEIQAAGHTSQSAVASELTRRGIPTRRGDRWVVLNVRDLIARIGGKCRVSNNLSTGDQAT